MVETKLETIEKMEIFKLAAQLVQFEWPFRKGRPLTNLSGT